jgi:cell wall assembly regulator SMI1
MDAPNRIRIQATSDYSSRSTTSTRISFARMIEAEFDRIEREMGITLPDDYRETMIHYPFPPDSSPAINDLCNNASELISWNKDGSSLDIEEASEYFMIGTDGSEELYFIDVRLQRSSVYVYCIDTDTFSVVAASLAEWVNMISEMEQEAEEGLAASKETESMRKKEKENKEKKWWRFWG